MTDDPLDLIEKGSYLCVRFMMRASTTITGCLQLSKDGGCYVLKKDPPLYHPLESVLIGQDIRTGDWRADVATMLGVSDEWIEGFIDGFALSAESLQKQDYLQGFLAGEEFRTARPRRFI